MEKNKQIRWGIILQYVQMALSIIIQLIYTPVMLKFLGKIEYGLYSVSSSIIAYLSLLSLGFGASYIRYYSKYKIENDYDGIKKLNGLYLIVFSIIGLVCLGLGLILSFNSSVFLNDSYTASEVRIASVLMLVLTINIALSFPASVFVSYVTSQEKFIFQKLLNIGKTVISPAVCIIVLYLGYASIEMVIVTTTISIFIDLINILYCIFKLKMRFYFKNLNFNLLKDIFIFSIFIAINQIIDQINWQTDKLILGKMTLATSGAVAIYSIGANINNMYLQFSTAISSVFTPKIHNIVANHSITMDEELNQLFVRVGRLQFFVVSLILSGFIFFGKYFISIWAGIEYEDAYYITILLITPATIPLIQNIGIEIQRAKNKHQFRSIIYLIMALINILISIWFCSMWGAIGCAFGTTISLLIANGLIMNIYYQKKLNINVINFWKNILKIIPSFIIPAIIGIIIMKYITITSIFQFLGLILLYSVVYIISILFLGFNRNEKTIIKSFFKFMKNEDNI